MEGIPINDLIRWAEKKRIIEESRAGIVPHMAEVPVEVEADCTNELDFIKNIESEFTVQADGILESLQLSHLRVANRKPVRHNI